MQSEFKPCPFCGAQSTVLVEENAACWHVECDCEAQGPNEGTGEQAITAWNTRASDAEITRLTEALRVADENINLKADFIDATINQLAAKDQDIYELKEALRAAEGREKGLREAGLALLRLIGPDNSRVYASDPQVIAFAAALKGPSHDA